MNEALADRRPITAFVLDRVGEMVPRTVLIDAPGPGEVLVRTRAVGVCHSDLHYVDGTHTTDLPEILGHEAAGIVEAVGPGVLDVELGDHVVTSLTMFCGRCDQCVSGRISLCNKRAQLRRRSRPSVIDQAGEPIGVMGGVGAFAEAMLVRETGVVRVDPQVPFEIAALLGCAVLTGVGAVTRSARTRVGDDVLVLGCGGIGLAAVMGARMAGARRIVAVDLSPAKLAAAQRFGATETVRSGDGARDRLRAIHPDGFDHAFEAVGRAELVELAMDVLRPGGRCTVLGMVPDSTPPRIRPSDLYFHEKVLTGAFIGSTRFTVDVPDLIDLYLQGRLPLDDLVTHRYRFSELNEAIATMTRGEALRVVVTIGPDTC